MKMAVPEGAFLALSAFEPRVALADVMHQVLRWCSPSFTQHTGVNAGDRLSVLYQCVPQARAAVEAALVQATPEPAGASLQARRVQPGLIALQLVDAPADGGQAKAVRRHLEDRERLLFTSRSLSVSEMASTLAHELNQPIGTVANVLRGMKTRLETPHAAAASPQALATGVQMALDQALFASRIIARIRDYTHSRQPRGDTLELGQVLRESLALLDWEIQRDGVAVRLDGVPAACLVVGDELMLQQTFVNLLRNALEAMREAAPGQRHLHIRLAVQREGREVELSIRDSGCGLPADAEHSLFVPFQSTKPNGMGIGLNICRSFIELHQGRLWFTRHDTGPGSTFHVMLPLGSEAALLPEASA